MLKLPFNLKNGRGLLWLRTGIIVFAAVLAIFLAYLLISGLRKDEPVVNQPAAQTPDEQEEDNAADPEEEEMESGEETGFIFERQELEEMFDQPEKIRQEAQTLVDGFDEAIEEMDLLIAEGEAASTETCELLNVYVKIDSRILKNKESGLSRRLLAFLEAVERGVLEAEFDPRTDEVPANPNFDHTILDESVLPADFDEEASAVGKGLKEEIISLRQRYRKSLALEEQLEELGDKRAELDPKCEPTVY